MKTIQLTLPPSDYTQSLRNLLLQDGTHRVYLVDRPDLRLGGVVVVDDQSAGEISPPEAERFVVITRKKSDHLAKIWDAGVRHVAFECDSPNTAYLAVISAELRLLGKHAAAPASNLSGLRPIRTAIGSHS